MTGDLKDLMTFWAIIINIVFLVFNTGVFWQKQKTSDKRHEVHERHIENLYEKASETESKVSRLEGEHEAFKVHHAEAKGA